MPNFDADLIAELEEAVGVFRRHALLPEDIYDALVEMFGGGQAGGPFDLESDDSRKREELEAWSELLAIGNASIWQAFRQAFASQIDALIEEREAERRIPNDRALTLDERRARLLALLRTQSGATHDGIIAAMLTLFAEAVPSPVRRTEVERLDSFDASIFQAKIRLTDEEWSSPQIRQAAERLALRILPARNVGEEGVLGGSTTVIARHGMRYGTSAFLLDRDTVAKETADHVERTDIPFAGHRRLGPASVLRARDLNALIASMPKVLSGGWDTGLDIDPYPVQRPGGGAHFLIAEVGASASGHVGMNLRIIDKMMMVAWRVFSSDPTPPAYHSSPFGFTTPDPIASDSTVWYAPDILGTAQLELTSEIKLDADAGVIRISNSAASTRWVMLFISTTHHPLGIKPALGAALELDTRKRMEPFDRFEDLGSLHAEDVADMIEVSRIRIEAGGSGSASDVFGAEYRGLDGARRVFYAPGLGRFSTTEEIVLDASMDWRDRYVFATASPWMGDTLFQGIAPGSPSDVWMRDRPSARIESGCGIFYTGAGAAAPEPSTGALRFGPHPFLVVSSVYLYARSSDGALVISRGDDAGASTPSVALTVIASPSVRSGYVTIDDGPDYATHAIVDGGVIFPEDVNLLSATMMMAQGHRAARSASGGDQDDVGSMPLGPIGITDTRLPMEWIDRDGRQARQIVSGHAERFATLQIADASIDDQVFIIDDELDWRDRIVTARFVCNALDAPAIDIRPGRTGEASAGLQVGSASAAERYGAVAYLGPGRTDAQVIGAAVAEREYEIDLAAKYPRYEDTMVETNFASLFADAETGALKLLWRTSPTPNGGGTPTTQVNALLHLFASPKLGPHSLGTRDEYEAGEAIMSSARRDDFPVSLSADLLARYRADLGVLRARQARPRSAAGGLAIAVVAVADQGPHELDLVQPDLSKAPEHARSLITHRETWDLGLGELSSAETVNGLGGSVSAAVTFRTGPSVIPSGVVLIATGDGTTERLKIQIDGATFKAIVGTTGTDHFVTHAATALVADTVYRAIVTYDHDGATAADKLKVYLFGVEDSSSISTVVDDHAIESASPSTKLDIADGARLIEAILFDDVLSLDDVQRLDTYQAAHVGGGELDGAIVAALGSATDPAIFRFEESVVNEASRITATVQAYGGAKGALVPSTSGYIPLREYSNGRFGVDLLVGGGASLDSPAEWDLTGDLTVIAVVRAQATGVAEIVYAIGDFMLGLGAPDSDGLCPPRAWYNGTVLEGAERIARNELAVLCLEIIASGPTANLYLNGELVATSAVALSASAAAALHFPMSGAGSSSLRDDLDAVLFEAVLAEHAFTSAELESITRALRWRYGR